MTELAKPGRPGINEQQYTSQIQQWLDDGERLSDITATMLQKAVGGQYKKAAELLERFKEGYETRELIELPPVPEKLQTLLSAAGLEIWRIVMDEKREQLAEATAVFEQDRVQLLELAQERLDRIDELENNEAELRDKLVALQAKLDERTEAWHQLKGANEGLAARNMELKERLQEKTQRVEYLEPQLEKQASANIELSDQLKDARHDLGKALGELKQLKELQEKLAAETKAATQFADNAKQVITRLEQQTALLQQKAEQGAAASKEAKAELHIAVQLREKMIAELASKGAEAEQAGKAVAALQKQVEKLQAELVTIAKKAK